MGPEAGVSLQSPQRHRCSCSVSLRSRTDSIMAKKKGFMTPERKKKLCQGYFDKWYKLEAEMFFLQREVILRDLQINELTISVSDMKGKFIKPTLKKVSKYENKFAKLQEKAAKFAFANQLKAK